MEVLVTSTKRGKEAVAFSWITEDGMFWLDGVSALPGLKVLHGRSRAALILTRAPVD